MKKTRLAIDMVYNEEIIKDFDATHAAFIGRIAGKSLKRTKKTNQHSRKLQLIIGGKM